MASLEDVWHLHVPIRCHKMSALIIDLVKAWILCVGWDNCDTVEVKINIENRTICVGKSGKAFMNES